MSGIVGVWNLNGRPVAANVLSAMSHALRHRGPDGRGCRISESVGFVCQQMWSTPEDSGQMQPLVTGGGAMLVLDGRIDNRRELLLALDLTPTVSDAACVLAAYEAWGDRFAERLNGDFAVAVFDAARQHLLLARDAIGIRPLYYYRDERLFAFATEIKALLTHPEIPTRPDREGIADFMLVGARPLDRQDLTCFAGISTLVPAHLATVTPDALTIRRYWDFDTGRSIRLGSFDEYVEAFHERFAEAVRRRARSARPVAVSVSGGLDSSSIFCQAETLRRSGAIQSPEIAGVAYIGADRAETDERRYLSDIESRFGVAIERFPVEPLIGLVSGAGEQIAAIEAPFLDYMWLVTTELHRRAAARGARVLLSGQWGDQVLFSSQYLVDLFGSLAWGTLWSHTREYAHWFGKAETSILRRRFLLDLARHHLPRATLPPLKWARRRLMGAQRAKPWFSDSFLSAALRCSNRPATIGEGFQSAHARAVYLEARSKYHVHCMEWNNKVCALHGLDAAFPFLDRDLLAFLMAIPGEVHARNGVPRVLLREAMRGVLPEPVRARRWKANFTPVVNVGVAQDAAVILRALSAQSLGVRSGFFEVSRLDAELSRLTSHLDGPDCAESWALADAFGLEVWLQVFSKGSPNDGAQIERNN